MNQYLKNPLVLSASAGVLAAAVSFVDHKMNTEGDFEPDMSRYFKVALLVSICTYGAITVLKMQCGNCPMMGGGSDSTVPVTTNVETPAPTVTTNVESAPWKETAPSRLSVSDQIHTGNPNF